MENRNSYNLCGGGGGGGGGLHLTSRQILQNEYETISS